MSDNESWADTHWLWHYKDHTVEVRLRDVAGQENADGNEDALMMEAANEITRLKERVEELESFVFDLSLGAIDGEFIEEAADELYNKANTGE